MVMHRRLIGRTARRARAELESGSRQAVFRLQLGGLIADLIRGGLVTGVLITVFLPIQRAAVQVWGAPAVTSRAIVVGVAAAVAGGIVWNALPAGTRRMRVALIAVGVIAAVLVG